MGGGDVIGVQSATVMVPRRIGRVRPRLPVIFVPRGAVVRRRFLEAYATFRDLYKQASCVPGCGLCAGLRPIGSRADRIAGVEAQGVGVARPSVGRRGGRGGARRRLACWHGAAAAGAGEAAKLARTKSPWGDEAILFRYAPWRASARLRSRGGTARSTRVSASTSRPQGARASKSGSARAMG